MKVLRIAFRTNEIARFRITSPLILIGRSPLCDIPLRAPGVGSVHFILEWIGSGDFSPETASQDEWAMTEIGEGGLSSNERGASRAVKGTGAIFHEVPLQAGDFAFSWVEDRLAEADLNKKIISKQIQSIKESGVPAASQKVIPVLEVITVNKEADSVSEIIHIPFNNPKKWLDPLAQQFSAQPTLENGVRKARIHPPNNSQPQLLKHGFGLEAIKESHVDLEMHDLLHVEQDEQEYYFRVVPKVYVPTARRAIWSDPFYIISAFCVLIGAFGFYLIFRNVKNEKQTIVAPPRIAQIEVIEAKPLEPLKPKEVEEKKETPPPTSTPPPPQDLSKKAAPTNQKDVVDTKMVNTKEQAQAKETVNLKNAPKVVDRFKGSLDNNAPKMAVNRTGFLSVLKKDNNAGMVKADQVLNKGIVNDSVKGDSAHFVVQQTASGVVNNQIRKDGDTLSAASTRLNFKDQVGSGSLNATLGSRNKEGFSANYGVSGEGGLSDSNFDGMVQAEVQGGLDRASVQTAIRGYKSEIRTCYEKALRVKSAVGGRVSFKFQITPSGSVAWVNVHKNDIESAGLVDCVQNVVKGIKFPQAKNGQSTLVIYPFQFAKKGS